MLSPPPPPPPPAPEAMEMPPPPLPPPPPDDVEMPPPPPPKKKKGWATPSKKPINVQEWIKNKKAEEAKGKKLIFIPKAEREARALAEKEGRPALKEEAPEWVKALRAIGHPSKPSDTDTSGGVSIIERMDAATRERYLGPDLSQSKFSAKNKRKRNAENKFKFDWDPEDDTTSKDPLYTDRSEDPVRKKQRLRDESFFGGSKPHKHWSQKSVEEMRERDWRIFKEDYDISTRGSSLPKPMRSWQESGLPKRLLDVVAEAGYKDPTPVQRAAIPIALKSRDLIGVAATGSGKTAAFLLPLLVYISELPALEDHTKDDGPYGLILAPTRELAQQIEREARKFATPLGFTCVSLIGGHSIEEQVYKLRNGAEIIVATPGRLLDCIDRRLLVLSQCCYVIMDEADRMIDMGFEEPVNKILGALPVGNMKPNSDAAEDEVAMSRYLGGRERYRQTMMYTATMPEQVQRMADKYLRRPAKVTIGNPDEAVETVEQRVEFVGGETQKKKRMGEILSSGGFEAPIIIFVNAKQNCDAVARKVKEIGFSSVTLHSGKNQDQREAALASLRNGSTDVLVATDLAGRGLDVEGVSLVLNFNMANNIQAYTHRIGRTGRAGKQGVAITFLGDEDKDVLYELRQMIDKSPLSHVPEALRRHPNAQSRPNKLKNVE